MSNTKRNIVLGIGISATLILVLAFFLIGFSFGIVDYDEIALHVSIDGSIENKTYTPGRYHIGLGSSFITYNSTFQYHEFHYGNSGLEDQLIIICSDGQQVIIDLSFHTQIIPEKLHELHSTYNTEYMDHIKRLGRAALRDYGQNWASENFYLNRSLIETGMYNILDNLVRDVSCRLRSFQLRRITLPDTLRQNLLNNQVQLKNAVLVTAQLRAAAVRQNTTNAVAQLTTDRQIFISQVKNSYETQRLSVVALIQQELSLTNRTIQELRINLNNQLQVYNAETENMRLQYEQNATQITEVTNQLEDAILNDIAILEAQNNATVRQILTNATTQGNLVIQEANARASGFTLEVQRTAFTDLIQAMNTTYDLGLEKLWVDIIESQDSSQFFFDLHKPDDLWLTGERELYIRSLGQTP